MTLILGHRGAKATHAENTLASFDHAISCGADGIELDVHLSKDGHIMVFHDFTLDRMCGVSGKINDFTLEELKQFKVKFKDQIQSIPTLDEVIALLLAHESKQGKTLLLNVELKAGHSQYPEIEKKVLALCQRLLTPEQVIYSSFDHTVLQTIKAIAPHALIGVLTDCKMVQPWRYLRLLKAEFYHPAFQALDAESLRELNEEGVALNVYTVNDPDVARVLIEAGCHSIITDLPEKMVALRQKIKKR